MRKDGKTTDNGRTRQKYCCPFRQSKTGACPCSHKNWNNGKKNRGCTKYKTVHDDYRLSIDRSCLYFRRSGGCAGRRFVRLSLLPRIQIIPARCLKRPLIRLFRSVFLRACFKETITEWLKEILTGGIISELHPIC